MQLNQQFTVDLPADQTWDLLTDVQAIAPCLPGARLTGSDGDTHTGEVKLKVGPVSVHYQGTIVFLEKDDSTHHAVLDASGKEARGSGTAKAKIDISLAEAGTGTVVTMVTDLGLTGRVAQFGRGIISDVSSKLIGQFVTRLEAMVAGGEGMRQASTPAANRAAEEGTAATGVTSSAPSFDSQSFEEDSSLNLGSLVGPELLRRALVPAVSIALGAGVTWLFTRSSRRPSSTSSPAGSVFYLIDHRQAGSAPW